jgi:low affinity Fe/Cu permease
MGEHLAMQNLLTQLNEQFTNIADTISEGAGRWWVTLIFFILIVIWALLGPTYDYSDTWQLIVNTSTTIITSFLCLFTLAAANRTEKRNWELHQNMMNIMKNVEILVKEEQKDIEEILEHDSQEGNG